MVLNGVLTRVERSLFEAGNHELLMNQRAAMQRLMADEMIASVRSILGREVISFMSTNDPEKEIGVELFVLESSRHAPHVHDHAGRSFEDDRTGPPRDGAEPRHNGRVPRLDGTDANGAGGDGGPGAASPPAA